MVFAGNPLDRAGNERRDDAWLAAQLVAPASRFLALSRLEALVSDAEPPALLWLEAGRLPAELTVPPVLLGLQDGAARYAIDVSALDDPLTALGVEGARFADARSLAPVLPIADTGVLAQARALVDWHRRHGFCAVCGGPTAPERGGVCRRCAACNTEHFPRTDPCVIMVVWSGDRCLIGRRPGRSTNMYSCLAGFIEQGESIEEAVRREVLEEAGVAVDDVVYRESQPWPFPSSLMIGCFAHAASSDLRLDEEEIAEAHWVSRDELRAYFADPASGSHAFMLPGPMTIAHRLIRAWSELPA
jgi:NAD+ diphosphatase